AAARERPQECCVGRRRAQERAEQYVLEKETKKRCCLSALKALLACLLRLSGGCNRRTTTAPAATAAAKRAKRAQCQSTVHARFTGLRAGVKERAHQRHCRRSKLFSALVPFFSPFCLRSF